jgi:hypothetical protein
LYGWTRLDAAAACLPATLQQDAQASITLGGAILLSHCVVLEGAGLGSLRQELESRTSGAMAGDSKCDSTIDFDTFDAALQATGHSILRHQVQERVDMRMPYDAHKHLH